ncbi:hypothetical protein EJ08DRAFT_631305 [Tothia fuscella]|uniref:DUF7726 domain-containing protein n=1 Tax=Tothia fuscella TaxID=1048955 RepID=A0A9P4NVU9_9PEZI|nr:hypothetical protein EJ08DRAFT_631305 [Tothia fuscella]
MSVPVAWHMMNDEQRLQLAKGKRNAPPLSELSPNTFLQPNPIVPDSGKSKEKTSNKRAHDDDVENSDNIIGTIPGNSFTFENHVRPVSNLLKVDNCDQTRRKIRRFLDNDGMTLKDFLSEIGCSSNGYYRFMKQHGPHKGEGSDVYDAAVDFFLTREAEGKPMPKKKHKTSSGSTADGASTKKPSSEPGKATTDYDLTKAELTDEEEDAVPVYSTCDEVRRQISNHLKKSNVTQALFLRDLKAQYHTDKGPARMISSQLEAFRSKKGPEAGNTSSIFYAAYVFFEKLRRHEGKPKSEFRLAMEKRWSDKGGFDIKRANKRVTCVQGDRPYLDEYGCMHISRGPNRR